MATRPRWISVSTCRREPTPACARYLFNRSIQELYKIESHSQPVGNRLHSLLQCCDGGLQIADQRLEIGDLRQGLIESLIGALANFGSNRRCGRSRARSRKLRFSRKAVSDFIRKVRQLLGG